MSKYHISPETGRPNICRASVRDCPIGGATEHYETKDDAREAYEKQMSGETFSVPVSKNNVVSLDAKRATKIVDVKALNEAWDSAPKYNFNKAQQKIITDLIAGKKIADEKLDLLIEDFEENTIADTYISVEEASNTKKIVDELKRARALSDAPSTLPTIDNFDPATHTLFSNGQARKNASIAGKAIRREFAHSEWMHELADQNAATARMFKAEGDPDADGYLTVSEKNRRAAYKSEARVQAQLKELQYLYDNNPTFSASSDIKRVLQKGWFRPKATSWDGLPIGTTKKV